MSLKPWNENIWFTPRFAINYFAIAFHHFGNFAVTSNKFKKAKEAWIMGVSLLGINKLTNNQWWLQVPKTDPPDMICMFIEESGNGFNFLNYRYVEITEITKHNKGTITDQIAKKLENKRYGKEYALLVYLEREEVIPDLRVLSAEIQKAKPEVADIWCLGSILPDSPEFMLFSLYPDSQRIDFDAFKEISKIPKGDILTAIKSKGKAMIRVKTTSLHEFMPNKK